MTAYPCCGPGSRTASRSVSRWPFSSSGRIGSTPIASLRRFVFQHSTSSVAAQYFVILPMRHVMDTNTEVFELAQATTADRARVGGKAGVLGELAAAGFPIPPGLVVTAGAFNVDGCEVLEAAAGSLGAPRLAVRSSGAAEDLPDASYAGSTKPRTSLSRASARRCGDASPRPPQSESRRVSSGTVTARPDGSPGAGDGGPDRGWRGLHRPSRQRRPRTGLGHRGAGLGDRLVSGEAVGEEWTVTARNARRSRPCPPAARC